MAAQEWTITALKRYLESLLRENDKRYETRFRAQEKAVAASLAAVKNATDKAEANSEKWRENANEWRAAMQDREAKFAPRIEMENRLKALEDKITELRESRSRGEGAGNQAVIHKADSQFNTTTLIALFVAALLLVSSIVAIAAYLAGRTVQPPLTPQPMASAME